MNVGVTGVAVVGLGKLGASMAGAIASKGYNVVGVDINQRNVDLINEGQSPVVETGLEPIIAEEVAKGRLKATLSHAEAIAETEACFVIVPTPSDNRGAFSLQYAKYAFKELGKALAEKDGYYLIVMTSTVLPGACRHGLIPVLEEASGKKAGVDFGFCYSPEFIALGSVVRDFLNPDFTLVGELDARSGDMIEDIYDNVMETHEACRRMSLENAELAKVALNSYVTMKISFANTLAEICQNTPGGNVDDVTGAIGFDTRIGKKYLKGGMGYGGPCFPRDNRAFAFTAAQTDVQADLAVMTDTLNKRWLSRHVTRVRELTPAGGTIAILGLAYKPQTPVIEDSQPIVLAEKLREAGFRVVTHDPLAGDNARTVFRNQVLVQEDLASCLEDADTVIVTNPDPTYAGLEPASFSHCKKPVVVYDLWRMLAESLAGAEGIRYVAYGRGEACETMDARYRELWA